MSRRFLLVLLTVFFFQAGFCFCREFLVLLVTVTGSRSMVETEPKSERASKRSQETEPKSERASKRRAHGRDRTKERESQ